MSKKILLWMCVLTTAFLMVGCGKGNGEGKGKESTMTGMVMSVDGTKVTLVEFDSEMQNRPEGEMPEGERPDMGEFPGGEGFENFNPGDFNPEEFDGEMPEGFDGEMPEMPEGFDGEVPEMPEGFEGEMPDFSERFSEEESTTVDLADAHIAVEIDGGKATGSMEDIKTGSFLTITMDKDGKVTEVLVSSQGGFRRGSENTEA